MSWGGTGLVGPGVGGEPLGWDEVLAGGVVRVDIAPLGPGAVHSPAVPLDLSCSVSPGEGAALTPAVDQWGGGLGGCLSTVSQGEDCGQAEEGDVTELHG